MVAIPRSTVEDALGVDVVCCDALPPLGPVGEESVVKVVVVATRAEARAPDATSAEIKAGVGTTTSGDTTIERMILSGSVMRRR